MGERVFVPGAHCFGSVRALFGATASRLVVSDDKVVPVDESLGERAALMALAATAMHATATGGGKLPERIVGHGILGRLLARITLALSGVPPIVWERNPERAKGAAGYRVLHPEDDTRRDYTTIYDVSGDASIVDQLISRLEPGGEIVLAGFYPEDISFAFAPAFMREARLRVAAEWKPRDMAAVKLLIENEQLSLDGLISHLMRADAADSAYRTAFCDPGCLKMILDWRQCT